MHSFSGNPNFCCYLAHILAQAELYNSTIRSVAALTLKNNIRAKWVSFPADVRNFVKQQTIQCVGDQNSDVRATVGVAITTIVGEEGVTHWADLLPTLCQMLQQPSEFMKEGALSTMHKVLEDSADRYEGELNPVVPLLLTFFNNDSAKLRSMSMSCINTIFMLNNDPINANIDPFIEALFSRAHDSDQEVQKELCRSLSLLLDTHMEKIQPALPNVVDFIINKTEDQNESVALEACEFWLSLAENTDLCKQLLEPYLPKLVPVLLKCMQYSPMALSSMKCDDDDALVPDRPEDIKPIFHKKKNTHGLVDLDDEDGEGGADDDFDTEWNIRRCSAASLDIIASIFGDDMLKVLLPILQATLVDSDWTVKESGILALGAVAEGCMEGMTNHLADLIPFLLNMLQDKKPLVRSISCWTLSRYCTWILSEDNIREMFFLPTVDRLLMCVLDNNKKVQEAACSAFAIVEEEACENIIPHLPQTIATLVRAFDVYQAKNLLILYDAVGTLANSAGEALCRPEYVQMLMPPLMNKWERLGDEDKELFPLLECVSSVATAMGITFLPYTEPVFNRCVRIIGRALTQRKEHEANPAEVEEPETDFMVVALDLLSGLLEALPNELEAVVSRTSLVELTLHCCQDETPEVRQSCFALLGDLTKVTWPLVKPHSQVIVCMIAHSLDVKKISVCNNAIWALGELSLRMGSELRGYLVHVITPLISIVSTEQGVQKTLKENAALTLGRLGQSCAEDMGPFLQMFIRAVCYSLRNITNNQEKESAFVGLCQMINVNPGGVITDFIFWCDAVLSFNNPKPELKRMFMHIFQGFYTQVGQENWSQFVGQFPPPLRQRLMEQYGL